MTNLSVTGVVKNTYAVYKHTTPSGNYYIGIFIKNVNGDYLLEEYIPFIGLIIFGNIENLILASQGVVQGVNPKILGGLSIIAVIIWLIIGTVATEVAIQYSSYITFIGGLAIVILGIQAIHGAVQNIKAKEEGV